MLAGWVAQNLPWGDDKLHRPVSVKIWPKDKDLAKGEAQQVLARAVYADGSDRDVTRLASFASSSPPVATIDPNGKVKAEGFGEAVLSATFMRRSDTARFLIPQPLPTPFPKLDPNNKIDELVWARLQKLGFPPAELCLRRGLSAARLLGRHRVPAQARGGPRLPGRPRPGQADQADRPPAGTRRICRLLGPQVGRPAADQKRVPRPGLAARRANVLPLGPHQHRGEQAVRPVRPRADHRQRQRFPGRPGQLLPRRAEAGTADLRRSHGRAVSGSPARLPAATVTPPRIGAWTTAWAWRPSSAKWPSKPRRSGRKKSSSSISTAACTTRSCGTTSTPSCSGRKSSTCPAIRTRGQSWQTGSFRRRIPGSPRSWPIASGTGCWDAGSSTNPTISARPTRPATRNCWTT